MTDAVVEAVVAVEVTVIVLLEWLVVVEVKVRDWVEVTLDVGAAVTVFVFVVDGEFDVELVREPGVDVTDGSHSAQELSTQTMQAPKTSTIAPT